MKAAHTALYDLAATLCVLAALWLGRSLEVRAPLWQRGVIFAVALALVLGAARVLSVVGVPRVVAFALGIALFVTTPLWVATEQAAHTGIATLALLGLAYIAFDAPKIGYAACAEAVVLAGILIACEPLYLLCALMLVALATARAERFGIVALLIGVAACAVAAHWSWRAHVGAFCNPIDGVYGLLLSTGKGLVWFAPLSLIGLVLIAEKRHLWRALAFVLIVVPLGAQAGWATGDVWGPAQLVPALALFIVPLGRWWAELPTAAHARRTFLAIVLTAGAFANVGGLVVGTRGYATLLDFFHEFTGATRFFVDAAADRLFIPQFSPIVGHLWIAREKLGAVPTPPPFAVLFAPLPPFDDAVRAVPFSAALVAQHGRLGARIILVGLALLMLLIGGAVVRKKEATWPIG